MRAIPTNIYMAETIRDRLNEIATGLFGVSRSVLVNVILAEKLGMSEEMEYFKAKYGAVMDRIESINRNCVK